MKKFLSLLMLLVFVINASLLPIHANGTLTSISGAVLNDQLNFKINDVTVIPVGDDGSPVLPITYNGTTYLPVRAIGYLLGLGIGYENATKTVLITRTTDKAAPVAKPYTKSNTTTPIANTLLNGQLNFKIDGQVAIPVGDDGKAVLPITYNSTTYLPVRAIGYLLGLGIGYENATKTVLITTNTKRQVWRLKEIKFIDGTKRTDSVLMGTTSGLYDLYSYTGDKNNLTITHNRFDTGSDKLLAGVTYQAIWTDPPEYLVPGEKYSVQYERKTISNLTWTAGQHSMSVDQGFGFNFASNTGVKYINSDSVDTYTMEKAIEKGTAGRLRVMRFEHANGFRTEYIYEWVD